MRMFLAVVVSVLALWPVRVLGQVDIKTLAKQLKISRGKLDPIAAEFSEAVRLPGSPKESSENFSQGRRVRMTWGDHDSDLIYKFAFGPGASYREFIGVPNNADWTMTHDKDLWTGTKYIRSVSDGAQGAIATMTPGWINPLGVGYELRMGEPIDALLETDRASLLSPNVVRIDNPDSHTDVTFIRFGDQTVAKGSTLVGPNFKEEVSVQTWQTINGHHYPQEVQVVRTENGVVSQTITFHQLKTLAAAANFLRWNGWNENAIVRDMSTNEAYRYRDGKLVVDPYLNQRAGAMVSISRLILIAMAVLASLWVAWRIWKRPVSPKLENG
jgi:hypothetical protein